MDDSILRLHNPNMIRTNPNAVPVFDLYGSTRAEPLPEALHWESIAARSRLFGWEIHPHRHERFFQIVYLRSGSGLALLPAEAVERHALGPGSLLALPPGCVHGFRFEPEVQGGVLSILRDHADWLLAHAPQAASTLARPLLVADVAASASEPAAIPTALEAIEAEFGAARPWRAAQCSAWLGVLMLQLARLARGDHAAGDEGPAKTVAAYAGRFAALLEAHFRHQHEPGWYAGRLGISTTHLTRLCQARLGDSARALIHRRIVAEAQRDLCFSRLSIKQIALTLGFDDPAHFTRFFTRAAGCTPTAYRKRMA
jgi:AraC family transcriptional activator of pobA